jgi:DNA topoisomerase II
MAQSRVVGGRHGYGAKLTNIFSDFFEVETFDSKRKKLYTQNWSDNMSSVSTPVIRSVKASEKLSDYTQITFEPQMSRFAATSGTASSTSSSSSASAGVSQNDLIRNASRLFEKRAYDMAATLPGVSVTFNGAVIPIPNFATYVKMYTPKSFDKSSSSSSSSSSSVLQISPEEPIADSSDSSSGLIETGAVDLSSDNDGIVYAKVNARWEVAVMKSSGSFDSVSFVNNLATVKGGTHVSLVTDQVITHPIFIIDGIYVT